MRKIILYTNGQRTISENCSAEIHGLIKSENIDISNATDDEFKQLFHNPHDDQLLQKIKNKGKIK